MKRILLVVAILFLWSTAKAQAVSSPVNVYAAGASFNQSATPAVAGTALYAHLVNDGSGTYAFTVYDVLPELVKPFSVTSNVSVGVAQKLFSIGNVPILVPTSAGISFNGSNTGWAWTTGAMASIKIKGNWRVFPTVRIAKSSIGGSGYQPIVGVMFGWGK